MVGLSRVDVDVDGASWLNNKYNMQPMNLINLVPQLMSMARDAGKVIMEVYASDERGVQIKPDHSPVTEADFAAHLKLVGALTELTSDYPVVSEEDEASLAYRGSEGCFWLIDPLDGTKEFLARNGEFTVNIALIDQGRSVLGVVYAPAIDCMYWGGAGLGAFRVRENLTEPIKVSPYSESEVCRVVASKSHLNTETHAFIEQLGSVSLVQAGSSLKFCRVAEGAADIYPRLAPTCEWDTAAAQAVLEGAGGCVVDLYGNPLRYGKPDVLNPSFIATRDVALIPL